MSLGSLFSILVNFYIFSLTFSCTFYQGSLKGKVATKINVLGFVFFTFSDPYIRLKCERLPPLSSNRSVLNHIFKLCYSLTNQNITLIIDRKLMSHLLLRSYLFFSFRFWVCISINSNLEFSNQTCMCVCVYLLYC